MRAQVESKCAEDRERFCASVQDEGSAVQDCLRAKLGELSPACREAEFKELVVETQSLELKPALLRSCSAPLQSCVPECGDGGWASPEGANCALRCLRALASPAAEGAAAEGGGGPAGSLPARCAKQLAAYESVATTDYRLMPGVPDHCAADIDALCAEERRAKGPGGEGPAGLVLECLAEKLPKIKARACKADIRALKQAKAERPEADAFSAAACKQDAALFCPDAEGPGLHECLQRHVSLLDPGCLHVEFEAAKAATADVAFNPKLKAACRPAIRSTCAGADGAAELLRCLEDLASGDRKASQPGEGGAPLGAKCAAEVGRLVKLKNKDYRLSPVLDATCAADMGRLCAEEKRAIDASEALGDGRVIDCLVDHRDEVRDQACLESVKRKMVQRVGEAANDPAMERDCGPEIEALCFDTAPGKGNLHRWAPPSAHPPPPSHSTPPARPPEAGYAPP